MLGDVGRMVRTGREDFLAVLPCWLPDDVVRFGEEACHRLGGLAQQYPFVTLPGVAATTVTRRRPLPIGASRSSWGPRSGECVTESAGSAGRERRPAGR
jgi:hypothetical protein